MRNRAFLCGVSPLATRKGLLPSWKGLLPAWKRLRPAWKRLLPPRKRSPPLWKRSFLPWKQSPAAWKGSPPRWKRWPPSRTRLLPARKGSSPGRKGWLPRRSESLPYGNQGSQPARSADAASNQTEKARSQPAIPGPRGRVTGNLAAGDAFCRAAIFAAFPHPGGQNGRPTNPCPTSPPYKSLLCRAALPFLRPSVADEIRPIFPVDDQTGAHRVFPQVAPFLLGGFLTAQQAVENPVLPFPGGLCHAPNVTFQSGGILRDG